MKPSVNPMLLSDEEWEKWRYKEDDYAYEKAFFFLWALKDYGKLLQSIGKIQKNNEPVTLEGFNVNFDDETPEEQEKIKNNVKEEIEGYFENSKEFEITTEEKHILEEASKFFCVHMTEATLVLAVRSLLKQYAAFKSTNVLAFTQLLPKYPHRRIIATMQFVMDVMDVNAFEPDGYAIRSIQKLRLMHAMIRYRIKISIDINDSNNPEKGVTYTNWNNYKNHINFALNESMKWQNEWGVPINQQDMLFAVHTFSIEVLKGIIASGEHLSDETIDNYYKAWHIIGRLLGVNDEINPSDYNIGVQVQDRIYAKEFTANNPNAKILAEPLIDFLDRSLPGSSRNGILGLVKLFNDKKDYEPVFKNILGLDLSQASGVYSMFYKTANNLGHTFMELFYKLKPAEDQPRYFYDIAKKQHKLFEMIISSEKTWPDDHFRVADGFGNFETKSDNENYDLIGTPWKRLISKYLPFLAKILRIKESEIK